MEIKDINIEDLIPAKYNPRTLSKVQYEHLKKSLTEFGFVDPVIVNKNNTIIGGHQRVKVWQGLGNDIVPCVQLDLNEEREKELNIRLNANTGEWDMDVLANEFELTDLENWGFDLKFPKTDLDLKEVEITETFEVVITCEDETDQQVIYEKLTDEGYKCKLMIV